MRYPAKYFPKSLVWAPWGLLKWVNCDWWGDTLMNMSVYRGINKSVGITLAPPVLKKLEH